MASRKYNFTTKICDKLNGPAPESTAKEIEYTDMATSVKLRVSKNRKTWYYRYTINGTKRVIRIGIFPGISVDEARQLAIEYGAMVDRGIDPQSQRDIAKGMPTFAEFANDEYMPFAEKHKRSADMDESKLRQHMLKVLGHKRICDISRRDVDMYRTAIAQSHSNATSNRHLALLSRMLGLAIALERGVVKNPTPASRNCRSRATSDAR